MSDTLFEPEWESVRAEDLVISLHRGRVIEIQGSEFAFTGTHRGADEHGSYIVVHGRGLGTGSPSVQWLYRPGDTLRVKAKGSGA